MKVNPNKISELIKRLRREKNMSQHELSVMLGFKNGQFISNVERKLCSIPTKVLVSLAQALERDVMEFVMALEQDYGDTLREEVRIALKENQTVIE